MLFFIIFLNVLEFFHLKPVSNLKIFILLEIVMIDTDIDRLYYIYM